MRNQNTPIAVEGYPFVALAALVTLGLALLYLQFPRITPVPSSVALALTLFIVYFFRNPERTSSEVENAVLAPADGVVVFAGNALAPSLGEEMLKVSVFMSVFDVHINRVPVSGRVLDTFYVKGKFLDARHEQATFENEQSGIVLQTDKGEKVVVVQVAGLIARRIVSYPAKGDLLQRGKRYGLIRFGSRLDIYLPQGSELKAGLGDRTVAGETVIGYLS